MPIKDYHAGIPYHVVREGSQAGCYQLHRPSKCRLKLPTDGRPIHKCGAPPKEYVQVAQGTAFRKLIVPGKETNVYPAVMPKSQYERIKQQAKIVPQAAALAALAEREAAAARAAAEAEARKERLRADLRPQPGAPRAAADAELDGPDQAAFTLTRAELLQAENMQGPRLCNRIILASKCHAIRDAQALERDLVCAELRQEEMRLDSIMEEDRAAAAARAARDAARRHELRLQNLAALKEQIKGRETAKIMEAERTEEECVRMNQASIALQQDEARRVRARLAAQAQLREMLDQGNEEILYFKQLQVEEERIMQQRVDSFLRSKHEREARARADAAAVKAAKQKGIAHIAKAQKAEQELKEELERVRNLKIQEDVEREYRRRERDAAARRRRDLLDLHKARETQINDIHRTIAREIAKDEQSFNNAARQNEESLRREKEMEDKRKAAVEKHRRDIMQQINSKEKARTELRDKIHNQGVALRLEQQQQDKYEMAVIKQKVEAMRQQKIPEKYVKEVEQTLAKHGYK